MEQHENKTLKGIMALSNVMYQTPRHKAHSA